MKGNNLLNQLEQVLPPKDFAAFQEIQKKIPARNLRCLESIISYLDNINDIPYAYTVRLLVDKLDKHSLQILSKYITRKHYTGRFIRQIQNCIHQKLHPTKDIRLENCASLISLYTNKDSGRVVTARNELIRRYGYQSIGEQRQLIAAFLHGSKTDRKWAYKWLLKEWDNTFLTDIIASWEQDHEDRCSWLVLKHAPIDYIWKHLDELSVDGNYRHVCCRLAGHPDFEIDMERLEDDSYESYPFSYLYVMAKAGAKVDGEEALEMLFSHIAEQVLQVRKDDSNPRYYRVPSISGLKGVDKILYYMSECGLVDKLLYFAKWEQHINDVFIERSNEASGYYMSLSWYDFCQIIKEEFPNEICNYDAVTQSNNIFLDDPLDDGVYPIDLPY